MSPLEIVIIFVAAMLAGALNSVAGGGSFLSYPALVFSGVPLINANTTSTIALWPGTVASVGAYRKEIAEEQGRLWPLLIASLLGGTIGALILLRTPQNTFAKLLPFLLLLATLLFAFGKRVSERVRATVSKASLPESTLRGGVIVLQFVIALYGGFFGGGIGMMMLAAYSLLGMDNIHRMNGLKTLMATIINGAAVVIFVINGSIYWPQALVMVGGAIIGGYTGATYAQRINPQRVRQFVILVGFAMTIIFFVRTYLPS
ncbi:MAG: TSUP family transporter [Anaerolineaceae bacterium]|nr:TSUP family transporter [Anaerolineaceae bacterium]